MIGDKINQSINKDGESVPARTSADLTDGEQIMLSESELSANSLNYMRKSNIRQIPTYSMGGLVRQLI